MPNIQFSSIRQNRQVNALGAADIDFSRVNKTYLFPKELWE